MTKTMKRKKPHLLIVDDERPVLTVLNEYFSMLPYHVTTVETGEEAMKILNSNDKIDLLIADIHLPGMSGIDLLKYCGEIRPDVPVIIITGFRTLDYAISALKHGAHDFITKPFELSEVKKIVDKVLRYRYNAQQRDKIFQFTKSMNLYFEIPTREVDPGVVASFLSKFLLNAGFCDKFVGHQIQLAFIETLINAIEHGNLELPSQIKQEVLEDNQSFENLRKIRLKNPQYADRKVKISFQFNHQFFSLTVTDEGPGFDWKTFLDEASGEELNLNAYGRGFMLIRHVIDEVYFNDKGNSITLIKSRQTTPSKD
ncbi:MAG: response regulator [Calditrichaeota bacterium]|nr:MAG: response regulator [Calditrichota bacterium]